jgi:hypothetical protein
MVSTNLDLLQVSTREEKQLFHSLSGSRTSRDLMDMPPFEKP